MKIQFLVIALAAGLAVSSGKKAGEPMTKLASQEVTYEADSITMKGYLVWDDAKQGKRPGILVVHEWWGHNAYARKRADMLAEMGYVALAVDMYGDGKTAAHPDDAMKFVGEVMSRGPGAMERFTKAMDVLKSNANVDGSKIGAIGYCFGGSTVLNMARQGVDLKGVVSFHGGLGGLPPAKKGNVKAQVLVCNGAADEFVTAEQISAFKADMDSAGAVYTFKNYEGAIHSFTNPGADSLGQKFGMKIGYNAAADSASWADMKAFFGDVLK